MPFKSEAQRRFMYSQHPAMAKRWEKETPKGRKLPKHARGSKHGSGNFNEADIKAGYKCVYY